MHELLLAYVTHVRTGKRLSERTVQLYTQELAKLGAWCDQQQLELTHVQPVHIRRWLAGAHSQGRTGRTLALGLSSWRGFFQWLVLQGRIAHNPCLGVRAPQVAKPLPKALGVDAAMALANYAPKRQIETADSLQALYRLAFEALTVELLYGCGLRASELVGLDVSASPSALQSVYGCIDSDSDEVHVFGKGSKRRMMPLGEQARLAYLAYCPLRQQLAEALLAQGVVCDAALFLSARGQRITRQTVWSMLRRRSQHAGLDLPVHPHMLRHSFASHVLQSSHDLRAVQELLGHSSIASTQVYTRLDFQHLAQIYDSSHPRAKLKKESP